MDNSYTELHRLIQLDVLQHSTTEIKTGHNHFMPPDRKPVAPLGSCDIAAQHTLLCHFLWNVVLPLVQVDRSLLFLPSPQQHPAKKQAISVILSWTSGDTDSYQRTGQTNISYPNKKLGHPRTSPETVSECFGAEPSCVWQSIWSTIQHLLVFSDKYSLRLSLSLESGGSPIWCHLK